MVGGFANNNWNSPSQLVVPARAVKLSKPMPFLLNFHLKLSQAVDISTPRSSIVMRLRRLMVKIVLWGFFHKMRSRARLRKVASQQYIDVNIAVTVAMTANPTAGKFRFN